MLEGIVIVIDSSSFDFSFVNSNNNNTTETLLDYCPIVYAPRSGVAVRLTHGDISILRPGGTTCLPLVAEGQC